MAKRAAPDEKPFRPLLDAGLLSAALAPAGSDTPRATQNPAPPMPSARVLEMPRPDLTRRTEQPALGISPTAPNPDDLSSEERPQRSASNIVEKFDQEKRILFTRREVQAIDRLVVSLATRLNSQVKVSHVFRAFVDLLLHAEGEIDKRAGEAGRLVRAPNGDAHGLQKFERDIGRILAAALRDAGPVR